MGLLCKYLLLHQQQYYAFTVGWFELLVGLLDLFSTLQDYTELPQSRTAVAPVPPQFWLSECFYLFRNCYHYKHVQIFIAKVEHAKILLPKFYVVLFTNRRQKQESLTFRLLTGVEDF